MSHGSHVGLAAPELKSPDAPFRTRNKPDGFGTESARITTPCRRFLETTAADATRTRNGRLGIPSAMYIRLLVR